VVDDRAVDPGHGTMSGEPMFGALRQDVRSALRSLRAHPGYACSVALTLAIGIGANIAVLTVVTTCCSGPCRFAIPIVSCVSTMT
jgi:hypothetical protein